MHNSFLRQFRQLQNRYLLMQVGIPKRGRMEAPHLFADHFPYYFLKVYSFQFCR